MVSAKARQQLHKFVVPAQQSIDFRMHAAVWRALCDVSRAHVRPPCRIIAGCRHPIATRRFHRSTIALQKPDEPTKPNDTHEPIDTRPSTHESGAKTISGQEGVSESTESTESTYEKYPRWLRARGEYGAAKRRLMRGLKPVEVPPVKLPEWFLEKNVILRENAVVPRNLSAAWKEGEALKMKKDHDYGNTKRTAEDFNYKRYFNKDVTSIEELTELQLVVGVKQAEDIHKLLSEWLDAVRHSSRLIAKDFLEPTLDPSQYTGGVNLKDSSVWDPSAIAQKLAATAYALTTRALSEEPITTLSETKAETSEGEAKHYNNSIVHDQQAITAFQRATSYNYETVAREMRRMKEVVQLLRVKNAEAEKLLEFKFSNKSPSNKNGFKHQVDLHTFEEVLATLKAGLTLRSPPNLKLKDIHRPVTLLHCPQDGATYFLNTVVQHAAVNLDADLVRIDAQDIAQIIDDYMGDSVAWTRSPTSLLGYEAQKAAGNLEHYPESDDHDVEEAEEAADSTHSKALAFLPAGALSNLFGQPQRGSQKSIMSILQDSGVISKDHEHDSSSHAETSQHSGTRSDEYINFKLPAVLETLVDAAETRRAQGEILPDQTSTGNNLIIQICEYKELNASPGGAEIISKLCDIVRTRWHSGQNIIVVGTTSAEDLAPDLSPSAIREMQSDGLNTPERTIVVAPPRTTPTCISIDGDAHIKHINVRHIEDMIRKMAGSRSLTVDVPKHLTATTERLLEQSVWSWSHVHRAVTTVLGFPDVVDAVDGSIFSRAVELLEASDNAKISWVTDELKRKYGSHEHSKSPEDGNASKETDAQKEKQRKFEEIKSLGSRYEKRLMGGVVDPSDINTTFAQVRAPPETIEALKTLTSLSLIRPEAFSYGVLATDKISGLLLYGPPGTGKTMLAKAVAKESGATVLEVSGGDLYDKYVGEGEKLVKALFSLAKKLSPCVVFIDEADAIFGARGGSVARASHRELINQFLREWDGLNNLSAFIMVATNRPFDLDDAVLRRLPRRILVDLPLEKDREEILKIHLKDEILDASVSIPALSKNTPFYSGSDLKNLSVAAALACVREENANAAQHTGSEPYVYPPRRILTKKHFDKAMEEISASVSEDMGTLAAIRKFDAKYGDRRGRRKTPGLGFGLQEPEKDSDAARVRQTEA